MRDGKVGLKILRERGEDNGKPNNSNIGRCTGGYADGSIHKLHKNTPQRAGRKM